MSERRRMLMAIANTGVWLPYSFEYLYHDLIPTTIDSKQVKNKLKLATIYGNSVVENQWNDDPFFDSSSNFTSSFGIISLANNEITFEVNNISNANILYKSIGHTLSFKKDHKYLFMVRAKTNSLSTTKVVCQVYNGSAWSNIQLDSTSYKDYSMVVSFTADITNQSDFRIIQVSQSQAVIGDSVSLKALNIIDLTQRYPFDTPTTLTDNRVQAILNRGYIPFNSGEIKSVDIGEFSSEPYNLFDETTSSTNHYVRNDGVLISDSDCDVSDYIGIIGGKTYTLENIQYSNPSLCWYDKDKNFISGTAYNGSTTKDFVAPNNAQYCRFSIVKAKADITCLHIKGTRTGYAPHTQPQTLSFKYQGSGVGTSHDTMEIDKENVVFTKNIGSVDLGTLNWQYDSSQEMFFVLNFTQTPSVLSTNKANILCSKYLTTTRVAIQNKEVCMNGSSLVSKDTTYTSASAFKTAMAGVPLEYQLATPQVITIPRKKLGVVDLGSLTYEYRSDLQSGCFISNSLSSLNAKGGDNYYCALYLNGGQTSYGSLANMSMRIATNTQLAIINKNYSNATDFKNAMSGTYLFYETQNEVADIIDTIGIDAGGTFTANWFSWVENQLCKPSTTSFTQNYVTVTNNGDGSFTLNGTATSSFSCSFNIGSYDLLPIIANHIYLLFGNKVGQPNLICHNMYDNGNGTIVKQTTAEVGRSVYVYITNGTTFNNAVYKPQVIDLTVAFGSGNEPTSVSDPRIQYIINQGYIPTNTTGTYKHVDYEVLTDVGTKIKGK